MKLATKTQHGLHILLHITAKSRCGHLAQGCDIAEKQNINTPYMEQLMITLKNAGLVQTVRGRKGGYKLAVNPNSITLLDIIELFEGELNLAGDQEILSADSRKSTHCFAFDLDGIWRDLSRLIRQTTSQITLSSILDRRLQSTPDYII